MQTIQNRNSVFSYERKAAVPAASAALMNDVQFSNATGPYDMELRLGISDPAAWAAGSFFLIEHNGRKLLTIDDQLADLLRSVFIPVELTGKDRITVSFHNGSALAVDAAAVVRIRSDQRGY